MTNVNFTPQVHPNDTKLIFSNYLRLNTPLSSAKLANLHLQAGDLTVTLGYLNKHDI